MILCTSDPGKVDKRTRSKWSRVLRYAAEYKTNAEPLAAFIQRKGGINKCASRFTRCRADLGSRGLGVRSASSDQGRLILRREVASTLASWNYRGLLLLRDADGRSLFDSLVHFLGGEQRPDRHAREPSHVGTQLRDCAVAAAISSG